MIKQTVKNYKIINLFMNNTYSNIFVDKYTYTSNTNDFKHIKWL